MSGLSRKSGLAGLKGGGEESNAAGRSWRTSDAARQNKILVQMRKT